VGVIVDDEKSQSIEVDADHRSVLAGGPRSTLTSVAKVTADALMLS
jgi:hypothetical protein